LAFWSVREELSQENRLRRSYYELLRDELDQQLIQYSLIDSYNNFINKNMPYPFVEKRELKPRARIPAVEHECQNCFLVIFVEDSIPAIHKKYIRFFRSNRTNKNNLLRYEPLPLSDKFDRNQKFLDAVHFYDLLKLLIPVDYALLIQRDPSGKKKDRYSLSHFHVKIDWPIADAAEDLGISLRYISKDLYEKGDKYAVDVQKKFFEYYCLPFEVGGRRTAAIVASQYLKRIGCISTVYAASSESRALIRVSERGASKSVLIKIEENEIEQISAAYNMKARTFYNNYVITREGNGGICIFQATYAFTNHARPPDDGKLREVKTDLNWLSVGGQHIMPKPGVWRRPPLASNLIYT
jgi:putative lipoic acid-binding regulatory protein